MDIKKFFPPILCLVIISLVVTVLLVLTNSVTAERISQLAVEAEEKARQLVLPGADSFSEAAFSGNDTEVIYYTADNGAGFLFTASSKGYGGPVVVMTGITTDGEIAGVTIVSQDETPGLGQKALESAFTDQYKITVPTDGFIVSKMGSSRENEIDALSGATITTDAVTNAVNEALVIYMAVTGGEE